MEAGRMRHKIVISSPPTAKDDFGHYSGDWATVLTTRAAYDPLVGREYFEAEQTQSQVEAKFTIRYRTGIQANYRVKHDSGTYEIVSEPVNVGGRNKELLLYCKKVTADG